MSTPIKLDGEVIAEKKEHIDFCYNDGGRSKYFKGYTGDCVVRAIAIASGKDYKEVYDELFKRNKQFIKTSRTKAARSIKSKGGSPRDGGTPKQVFEPYLKELGFKWVSTMGIGTGMTMHVREDELPSGTLILRLSRHLTCVMNGALHDTYDCSREGTRGVYGYWIKE